MLQSGIEENKPRLLLGHFGHSVKDVTKLLQSMKCLWTSRLATTFNVFRNHVTPSQRKLQDSCCRCHVTLECRSSRLLVISVCNRNKWCRKQALASCAFLDCRSLWIGKDSQHSKRTRFRIRKFNRKFVLSRTYVSVCRRQLREQRQRWRLILLQDITNIWSFKGVSQN